MFAYLKGTLTDLQPDRVIVEANGIGYSISIHRRLFDRLPEAGSFIRLYTTFVIREFSQTLYGFDESDEREIFETLIGIAGIGPKLALSLLGSLTFAELHSAVSEQNVPALCKVPGVGKKTAERLIVELKDKLQNLFKTGFPESDLAMPQDPASAKLKDAMLALINLGYHQSVAQKALKQSSQDLPEEADLACIITAALKHL